MIAVVGAGISGITVANHAVKSGADVVIYDEMNSARLKEGVMSLLSPGVEFVQGMLPVEKSSSYECVVISPGVPRSRLPLPVLQEYGTEVIGEVEYAFRNLEGKVVAITGTNGKSTVTSLTGLILEKGGVQVFTGGNLKDPLTLACERKLDVIVAELSSFQLESIVTFRPHVAAILNVGEDHLDRYAGFEEYLEAKGRIFMNQLPDDYAIFNADCPLSTELAGRSMGKKIGFSSKTRLNEGAWIDGSALLLDAAGVSLKMNLSSSGLKGRHNMENVAAASLAALLSGASTETIEAAVDEFKGLPHRMEYVGSMGGIDFCNDSKGTNVHALCSALRGSEKKVVLIAGGKDKGLDFSPVLPLVREKVRFLVLIGEASHRMGRELGDGAPWKLAESMDDAVETAYENAISGDMVLLSPGCSSFDMYASFEERGGAFKNSVSRLLKR